MDRIVVNNEDWDSVPEEDQEKIKEIISDYFDGQEVDTDGDVKRWPDIPIPNPGKEFCRAACDVAFTTAQAACLMLANPIAQAACIATATQAKDVCKRRC